MQVRAAFGLFDAEGTGCVAGDRLEAYLVEAGFRLDGYLECQATRGDFLKNGVFAAVELCVRDGGCTSRESWT